MQLLDGPKFCGRAADAANLFFPRFAASRLWPPVRNRERQFAHALRTECKSPSNVPSAKICGRPAKTSSPPRGHGIEGCLLESPSCQKDPKGSRPASRVHAACLSLSCSKYRVLACFSLFRSVPAITSDCSKRVTCR